MNTSMSASLARLYVSLTLFTAAYAPLTLLFALRLMGKGHPIKARVCVVIFVLVVGNLIGMFRLMRSEPDDFVVADTDSGGAELASFVATFLLPFVLVGDVTNWDLGAYAIYMFIVGVISIRGDYLHLNPLLALRGYRVYTITTGRGRRWLALSLDAIRTGDKFKGRRLSPGVLLVTTNWSAIDRKKDRITTN